MHRNGKNNYNETSIRFKILRTGTGKTITMKLQSDLRQILRTGKGTNTMKLQTNFRQILRTGKGKQITMKLQTDFLDKSFAQEREETIQ